jgi:hypothetical protein
MCEIASENQEKNTIFKEAAEAFEIHKELSSFTNHHLISYYSVPVIIVQPI